VRYAHKQIVLDYKHAGGVSFEGAGAPIASNNSVVTHQTHQSAFLKNKRAKKCCFTCLFAPVSQVFFSHKALPSLADVCLRKARGS
jgi:hypothetical protein